MNNDEEFDSEQQPIALRTLAKATRPRCVASLPRRMEPPKNDSDTTARAPPLALSDVDEDSLLFENSSLKSCNNFTPTTTPRALKFVHFNVSEALTPTTPDAETPNIGCPSQCEAPPASSLPTSDVADASAESNEQALKLVAQSDDKKDGSNTNEIEECTRSVAVDDSQSDLAKSDKGDSEGDEKLVEIKPRRRDKRGCAARRVNANPSAFDGVPPAEIYDPSWNTAPLRVEGGQLRDRRNRNKPGELLLPNAFRGVSSESSSSGASSDGESTTGIRSMISGLSLRRRATSEGGHWAVEMREKRNIVEMGGCAAAALRLLDAILRCDFGADIVALKAFEMRARVPIAGAPGTPASPRLVVISAVANWAEGCRLVFRRSLTDATRMHPDAFLTWVEDVRSRLSKVDPIPHDPLSTS